MCRKADFINLPAQKSICKKYGSDSDDGTATSNNNNNNNNTKYMDIKLVSRVLNNKLCIRRNRHERCDFLSNFEEWMTDKTHSHSSKLG